MPFILSILTIILGMMIDLFKAINDFINDILIEWIDIILKEDILSTKNI